MNPQTVSQNEEGKAFGLGAGEHQYAPYGREATGVINHKIEE